MHKNSLNKHGRLHEGQEKSSFAETEKCATVRSRSENSEVLVGEEPHISCECGKTSLLENSSDCRKRCRLCVSYCKLCEEGLKECGCCDQECRMASGESNDDFKNVNVLEDTGMELHERVSVKDEIDIDEIPFENQVSEEFDYFLVKSEVECN